jgi:hypothetical protein
MSGILLAAPLLQSRDDCRSHEKGRRRRWDGESPGTVPFYANPSQARHSGPQTSLEAKETTMRARQGHRLALGVEKGVEKGTA